MKFLYYFGRHGEKLLTEHTPKAWEALKEKMQNDNRMSFDEAVVEFGHECLYGSLDYSDRAHIFMDDGGEINTLWLSEVSEDGGFTNEADGLFEHW